MEMSADLNSGEAQENRQHQSKCGSKERSGVPLKGVKRALDCDADEVVDEIEEMFHSQPPLLRF